MNYSVDTQNSLQEAVNYLLSGPASLGQTFEGMSAVGDPAPNGWSNVPQTYFTGSLVAPYTAEGYPANYWPGWATEPYAPYTITNITSTFTVGEEQIFTVDITSSGQNLFYPGQLITLTGVTPAGFNTTYTVIDTVPAYPFVSTPLTGLIIKPVTGFDPVPTYTSGGEVVVDNIGTFRPTDCSAVVTVTGPTDRVFLSNQTTMILGYWQLGSTAGDVQPTVTLAIRRYRAVQASAQSSDFNTEDTRYYQGFEWQLDGTPLSVPRYIAQQVAGGFYEEVLGTNTFINVIDSPGIGHYWYIFEIKVEWPGFTSTDFAPNYLVTQDLRSFTAQVIKR
jgi:hypothetical protein